MAGDDRTTIWISDDLWTELNRRKSRGDTFEDVIWRLIDEDEEEEAEPDGGGMVAVENDPDYYCKECELYLEDVDALDDHARKNHPETYDGKGIPMADFYETV